MNVLYITHYEGLYGANKSLLEIVKNMKQNYNLNVVVITPKYGDLNEALNKLNIENKVLYFFPWAVPTNENKLKNIIKYIGWLFYNNISVCRIKKIIKNYDINIVHTNSSISDIGSRVARKINAKHFWHVREYGKEDYDIKYFKNNYIKYMEKNSDKIIFISKDLENKYSNLLNTNKYTTIYNGVDKDKYYIKVRKSKKKEKLNILVTGLISENKNQIEVLEALNILINKKGYTNITCKIVGGGNEIYIKRLKKYADKNKLNNYIDFTGYISNIRDILIDADIGIMPSKKEAFGRVTIEYMIAGIPVIGSDSGANMELIKDGFNGFIYNLGNSNELAETIEKYYLNSKLLECNSINAQNYALENYTSSINSQKIYDVYRELIECSI